MSSSEATASVLVVDDDVGVLTAVSRMLQAHGFIVFTCANGRDAIEIFHQLSPSLVLLDVKLPETDGVAVCRRLRSESDVPIIMLTVLAGEADVARALEAGADDYVRKPFGTNELIARVRAVLRRAGVAVDRPERLTAGPLTVDERQHVVLIDGAEVMVSPTEFRLLAYLVRNQDRVLTHDYIIAHVWGAGYVGSHNVLRVTMSRLRHKLEGAGRPLVETLPGVGYRLRSTDNPV